MDGPAFSRAPLIIGDETVGEHQATGSSVVTRLTPWTRVRETEVTAWVSPGIAMMEIPGEVRRLCSFLQGSKVGLETDDVTASENSFEQDKPTSFNAHLHPVSIGINAGNGSQRPEINDWVDLQIYSLFSLYPPRSKWEIDINGTRRPTTGHSCIFARPPRFQTDLISLTLLVRVQGWNWCWKDERTSGWSNGLARNAYSSVLPSSYKLCSWLY